MKGTLSLNDYVHDTAARAALDATFGDHLAWRDVRVHFGARLPLKPWRAMTIGWHIFTREPDLLFGTMAHELGHMVHYTRLGPVRFLGRYAWHWLRACVRARRVRGWHAAHPLEEEARQWADAALAARELARREVRRG
jgi:hypothetical protein